MAERKKKLGKGLEAIFGSDIDSVLNDIDHHDTGSTNIKVDDIRPNPYQPRKHFDDESLKELADSIKEHGVFQPIIVRKSNISGYELIAGERRLRASKLADKKDIPAIIVEMDDTQMMEISLLENIQREDLSAIEEAEAYDSLINKLGYTQDELAKRIGKSRVHVTNMLRLLKLPPEIKTMVSDGKLSYGQARTILAIDDEEKAIALAKKAVKEGLTVRQLEKMTSSRKDERPKVEEPDIYLDNVRRIMEEKLATKVEVKKHKITISFTDDDDLNRILEKIDCLDK